MKKLLLLLMASLFSAILFAQELDISPPLKRQMVVVEPLQIIFSTKGMVKMYWGPFYYGNGYGQVVFTEKPHVYIRPAQVVYKPLISSNKSPVAKLLLRAKVPYFKTQLTSTRLLRPNAGVWFTPLRLMSDSTFTK